MIDVNSGRYAARREQELNSLKTNLEAARIIARQLRLRDIGGIIVIDFIDMAEERNRKKVYDEMRKELRNDRAKSSVLTLTEFGLMQITRQRIRQSIVHTLSETCPVCGGTGLLVSRGTIIRQIERWLERFRASAKERSLVLKVHPTLYEMLAKGFISPLRKLELKYIIRIKLELDESLMGDDFKFFSGRQKKDITSEFSATAETPMQDDSEFDEEGSPSPKILDQHGRDDDDRAQTEDVFRNGNDEQPMLERRGGGRQGQRNQRKPQRNQQRTSRK